MLACIPWFQEIPVRGPERSGQELVWNPAVGRDRVYQPGPIGSDSLERRVGREHSGLNRPDFRSVLQVRMEHDEQEVFAGDA